MYWIIFIVLALVFGFIIIKSSHDSSPSENQQAETPTTTSETVSMFKYIEITEGCDSHFKGECVNMRSGPGTNYPVLNRLRTGIVLKVSDVVVTNNYTWYKIKIDDTLYYPERAKTDWYVGTNGVRLFEDNGTHNSKLGYVSTSTKKIIVDVSKQTLSAYDGSKLFMKVSVSTGLELTPTTIGTFHIYKMTPSRYMQGPLPGSANDQYFDLPGVPWDLYFTNDGQVIHGAYWDVGFGHRWSHGCVNVPPQDAKKLYMWTDIGTEVVVER